MIAVPEPSRHSSYPLDLLRDLADAGVKQSILQGAARQLRQTQGKGHEAIRRGLLNRIDGFGRAPFKAEVPMIARELKYFLFTSTRATRDLVELWVKSVDGLEEALENFMETAAENEGAARLLETPPDDWSAKDLLDLAGACAQRFPDVDSRAVAIMLGDRLWEEVHERGLADGDATSDVEEEEAEKPAGTLRLADKLLADAEVLLGSPSTKLTTDSFSRLIDELDRLSWDAPEWDELPAFVAAVVRARGRAAERAEALRSRIAERFRLMPERHAGALRFVEYQARFFAGDLRIPVRQLTALQTLCDSIEERLSRLDAALQSPPTRSAAKDWNALADEVRPLLERVDAIVANVGAKEVEATVVSAPSAPKGDAQGVMETLGDFTETAPAEPLVPAASLAAPAAASTVVAPAVEPEAATIDVPQAREKVVAEVEGPAISPEPVQATTATIVSTPPVVEVVAPATDNRSDFQCVLVGNGDLAGGYWLARALADSAIQLPFPDWLLAAAQATPWLAHDSDVFVDDLLHIASNCEPAGVAQHLLALSVALKATVVAPTTGLGAWLRPEDLHYAAIREVCEATAEFGAHNTAVRSDDLRGVSGAAELDAAIRASSAAARQRLETAEARGWKMRRAHDVWLYFARHELPNLLGPVAADDRSRSAAVRSSVERWRRARDVQSWIAETDAKLAHRPQTPIVGDPRDQIMRRVADCSDIARLWCDQVQRAAATATRGNWFRERVKAFQSALAASLPRADTELRELSLDAEPAPIAAAARVLRRSMAELATILDLPVHIEAEPPAFDAGSLRAMTDATELERALSTRLLWLPELDLDVDGRPGPDALPRVADALQAAARESRTLLDAYRGWTSRRDFRFVDRLATALLNDPGFGTAQEEMNGARDAARGALRAEIARTQDAIEQAVVDSIISDQRSEYAAETEIDVQDVLDFGPRFAALARISEGLEATRRARLAHSRDRWRVMEGELASRFPGPRWESVRGFVQSLVSADDPALIECLERLEDVLDGRLELPGDWIPGARDRDVFAEFLAALSDLEDMAARAGLAQVQKVIRGRGSAFRDFSNFPQPRLDESDRALDDWVGLKTGSWTTSSIARRLGGILEFAGFTLSSDVNRLTVASEGPDWAHVRARMSASNLSPVPQFGSQARGVYEVLCVRERPGVDLLGARLRDAQLEGHPVIVVYLARLPVSRRRELNRLTRRADLPIVALDELLLLFLTGERDARLPVFLRCALPYSSVNPFTPAQAGDVPPEMFYGRQEMVRELERPEGGCVVYGGRQLGKSVLLRRVERDLHVPERASYARVIDIKLVGDPHSDIPVDDVWRRVRDAFKDFELLPQKVSTDQPREIFRQVRDVLRKREIKQVVLLFDEADAFLDADSRQGFRVVTELRELMNESRRRFKVVFAGLQNVQRFQGIPNQPLAHFGQPIRVGPLEPEAAERLVREPLQTLGYRFADSSAVLRVLSYTNYHPGLIQLFCQQLLRAHRASAGTALPPYTIGSEDAERVYRQPLVRQSIRERFDWTLALDVRYQCTAWAMIVDQISDRDSYARPYSPRGALALVRSWWPGAFSDMKLDHYRAILDEMEGLGVLRRTPEGQYRLRSPNLVRLMGHEADIGERLLELAQRQDIPSFDADSFHALLDGSGDSRRYSPLTYADARQIAPPQSGVSLVFGAPALGIDVVPEAIERALFAGAKGPTLFTDLSRFGDDADSLREQLRRYTQANQRYDRLGAVEVVAQGDPSVGSRIEAARQFCQARAERRDRVSFRVAFVFPPGAAWQWLAAGDAAIESENRVDSVTSLSPWNAAGLRRRLEQHDKIAAEAQCRRLLDVTGGWPPLVEEAFRRCGHNPDIQGAADEVLAEVASGGPIARRLLDCLGLGAAPRAEAMLTFVRELGSVGVDELLPELIDPSLTERDCQTLVEWLSRMSLLVSRDGKLSVDPIVARVLAAR